MAPSETVDIRPATYRFSIPDESNFSDPPTRKRLASIETMLRPLEFAKGRIVRSFKGGPASDRRTVFPGTQDLTFFLFSKNYFLNFSITFSRQVGHAASMIHRKFWRLSTGRSTWGNRRNNELKGNSVSETKEDNYRGVWGNRLGFGKSMALLVIDFIKAYTTHGSAFYAEGVVEAVSRTPRLLAAARAAKVPIVHTNIIYTDPNFADAGIWAKKAPSVKSLVADNPLSAFCSDATPIAGEIIISKQYPSAFFGTTLASTLHTQSVDTVLIAGCTTSGCVRASAVDAMSHGFRPIIVRDCVGDRHDQPHEANLFDIAAKYGDVVGIEEAVAELARNPLRGLT